MTADRSELVQARVSKAAKQLIREEADRLGISEAAYVRQLLYKGLRLDKRKGT